jgi:hypothetical protein
VSSLARKLALPIFALGALAALGPMATLDCQEPFLRSVSPDGQHSITVCRRFRWTVGMPGQGSDGPGWVVLRDAERRIAGVVDLGMLGSIGTPASWTATEGELPLIARFTLPAEPASPFAGFLREVGWRLRAAIGVTPSDTDFR